MTCTCGHPMADHMDRTFFGASHCRPPAGTTGFATKACSCDGWTVGEEGE